jgi:hypothetical protein
VKTPFEPVQVPQAFLTDAFLQHYRAPSQLFSFQLDGELTGSERLFRVGDMSLYGHTTSHFDHAHLPVDLVADRNSPSPSLRFNPSEVAENLRQERYIRIRTGERYLQSLYYFLRPAFGLPLRALLQRLIFRSRRARPFPEWPVDCTVEQLLESLMASAIATSGEGEVPFIWFWPDGNDAALMMTHDVEDQTGVDNCDMLMDLDDAAGIKAAFQLIPRGRYNHVDQLSDAIRRRGFEVNLHDLDHDGRLYQNLHRFESRIHLINSYAHQYRTKGFRAGAMHRNQQWFHRLHFDYDMSVPNVAHLEPQRGGCRTVTPYFVGSLLELPLTTVQDHALFYVLRQNSIQLWKEQIELIYAHNGLISFLVHPDYLVRKPHKLIFEQLLQHITTLRSQRRIWCAVPGEINRWWRLRSQMRLVHENGTWKIYGKGSERARVAYATLHKEKLVYRVADGANALPSEYLGPTLDNARCD